MNLKNTIFILVIIVFLLQMVILKQDAQLAKEEIDAQEIPTIFLSTYPLYDIAKNIAKDKINTQMILPIGVDVHSFEPNPKQIIALYKSDLIVFSGASLEPWIAKLDFKNKVLDMSKEVDLLQLEEDEHHHEHESADEHSDPHYWLSIKNMKKLTQKLTEEIIQLDKVNEVFYTQNKKHYLEMLDALDTSYKTALSSCEKDEILTNHNAFSYLAKEYSFKVLSLSELSPDAQTNAKNMIHLIQEIKSKNISTIFYESFASSKAIKAIAHEAKIEVKVLQPLANITQEEKSLSYEDIMLENLVKISEAMECR